MRPFPGCGGRQGKARHRDDELGARHVGAELAEGRYQRTAVAIITWPYRVGSAQIHAAQQQQLPKSSSSATTAATTPATAGSRT